MITDFDPGEDRIGLSGLTFAQLSFADTSSGVAIRLGAATLAVLPGVRAAQLKPSDFMTV